tara:strand:+ start:2333 stop:3814 length:1482 start_codon:yes stop_codon:yes gene_type:complete
MNNNKIIKFFLVINLLVFISGYFIGFKKPFWIDEIISINYGSNFSFLSLNEIFTQDPHSPFFYFLLFLGQKILEVVSNGDTFNLYYLRLINILGFIPIYYSYLLIKRKSDRINLDINIFILLLISSNYFFYYVLDLRMYFLLLSFSLLVNVINFTNTVEKENKILFLLSSILLSMLHVYGLTISMSILVYRLVKNTYLKDKKKRNLNIIFIITLLFIFIVFYFPSIFNDENMKMLPYIKNNLWYYRVFIEWNISTLVLIFSSLIILFFHNKDEILIKNNVNKFFKSSFFNETIVLAAPAIILMMVVLTISFLFIPIVHYRNLIVIYPNLILYASFLSVLLIDTKKYKIFFIVFLMLTTFINIKFYFKNLIKTHENIEWVVKKTFTKNCSNIPVFFNDNGNKQLSPLLNDIIFMYSKYNRPILSLSKIDNNKLEEIEKVNKYCKIHIFSFHTYDLEENLNNLNYNNLKLDIKYAPNVVNEGASKSGAIVLIENN